ncbi:hypothetical protein N657DRAFT_673336 [Parathielavia appendiculata]|uniref:Uncharacterized protein n=1 Tax=Parathielavia appendiculata TaxID=2587402 RepID=A0AAN6TVJ8_9PEZI|nr:hypothetical protein N657DRAFT_673336 [Parathielavia appendiculata]
MEKKRLFDRLRDFFRRKNGKTKKEGPNAPRNESVIVHHPKAPQPRNDHLRQVIESSTLQDMRATADAQALSAFFQRLPVEIRLKIYHHVLCNYLKPRRVGPSTAGSNLRLHIYTPAPASKRLTHTRCKIHPGEPGQKDVLVTQDIHSEDWPNAPPWYRDAWVLRLNWGKHWKCQHAIQKQWNLTAQNGDAGSSSATGAPTAPFLPLFLACKRMYLESAQSLFETVTLVFTSSTDAHQFFMVRPHPFLAHLRNLELSIAYTNDHLFLSRVLHDNPPRPSTSGSHVNNDNTGTITTTTATITTTNDDASPRGASVDTNTAATVHEPMARADVVRDLRPRPNSICFNLVCRLDRFGAELWPYLIKGIRAAAPKLRELDVEIGGRIARDGILGSFGFVEKEEDGPVNGVVAGGGGDEWEEGGATLGMREERRHAAAFDNGKAEGEEVSRWTLPGRLVVVFSGASVKEGYVQAGKEMVRMQTEPE